MFYNGATAVLKTLIKSVFGPCVMLSFLMFYLLLQFSSKCHSYSTSLFHSATYYLTQAFLLVFLISYQQTITGLFTLVQCVQVQHCTVLYVQGDFKCYTWWQILIKIFLALNIFPLLVVLSHLPFHLKEKKISTKCFLLSCLFPVPVLIYVLFMRLHEMKSRKSKDIESNPNIMKDTKHKNDVKEPILYTLLEHYRILTIFGFKLTWLGIHKLYRLLLVCNTYIIEPIPRLSVMISILFCVTICNVFVKPDKNHKANRTATLSYIANLCIAIVNFLKAGLVTFDCKTNCFYKTKLMYYICHLLLL